MSHPVQHPGPGFPGPGGTGCSQFPNLAAGWPSSLFCPLSASSCIPSLAPSPQALPLWAPDPGLAEGLACYLGAALQAHG